jgi:hypothetical protein
VEERDAKFGLERLDLLRDGWLGEQEFFGSDAEVEAVRDRAEDPEAEVLALERLAGLCCVGQGATACSGG